MIGLLVLGALVVWFFIARGIARWLGRALPIKANVRPWASAALFVIVFLSPVADELVARPYFMALCRQDEVLKMDAHAVRGRRVSVAVDPANQLVTRVPIEIVRSHVAFRDATTGAVLAEYDMYQGAGGRLARFLSLTSTPGITGRFFCSPEEDSSLAEQYGLVVVR
jgi:hypothetical protein